MIPGLDADQPTLERIESAFGGWADHFRKRLIQRGIRGLFEDYGQLVRTVETRSCDHGGRLNTGEDWRQCCGISYEYTNDLAVRDTIDLIVEIVGADRVQGFDPEVVRLDQRLYSLYKHCPPRVGRWWHTGFPIGIAV